MKDAIARLQGEDLCSAAAYNLFEAYLDTGNWKEADRTLPLARSHLTPAEILSQMSAVALAAARSGAQDDAMRIWQGRSELDFADLRGLGELAKAGLADRLQAYYRQMERQLPASVVPAEALRILALQNGER